MEIIAMMSLTGMFPSASEISSKGREEMDEIWRAN